MRGQRELETVSWRKATERDYRTCFDEQKRARCKSDSWAAMGILKGKVMAFTPLRNIAVSRLMEPVATEG